MIDERIVKHVIGSTGDYANTPWAENDGEDGIVIPIGIGQVTQRMAKRSAGSDDWHTWCNERVLLSQACEGSK